MKKIIYPAALLSLVILANTGEAQDIHFSEFNENSSLVNPALTGQSYVVKALAIYKDQWRSVTVPYKTYGASVEMKFKAKNWERTDAHSTMKFKQAFNRVAGGLSFFNDKAGDGNMGTTQVNLSLATFVPLNSKSSLSVGLQGSFVQRKIDYSKLIWPDQYNGTTYDMSSTAGENFTSGNFVYPDFAAGLAYSYGFNERAIGANDQFKIDLGAAMFHMGNPKQNYLGDTHEILNSRYVFHSKAIIGIKNTKFIMAPSAIFEMQGTTHELIYGTYVKYNFKEDSKYTGYVKGSTFSLGAFYRNKDAMIAAAMLEFGQYAIGFSYDINTSGLTKVSSSRGGFEVFLRFVTPSPYLYQRKAKAKFI